MILSSSFAPIPEDTICLIDLTLQTISVVRCKGAKPNEITYLSDIVCKLKWIRLREAEGVFSLMGKPKDEASRYIEELVQT
ncbi:hypothetical protein COLO4_20172 [Corchorus olitorius]|uniref:Uncharacterized protein n=1 Tax=Corchorus olitorius TaxID=93759 RepID=A0A1R3J194_9ROSI|nr:hypothetical protein COLO4_20172 [Corchorus olitorius]